MQQTTPFTLDQLAGKATITMGRPARLLGLGRTAAYDAARRGELPSADWVGGCWSVPALLEWLGAP